MLKQLITACIITKDEEPYIERCINSIIEHVGEVVVVDTGSSDDTVEIARRCGARTFQEEWKNSFSIARNTAIEYARYPVILMLDADEELEQQSINELNNIAQMIDQQEKIVARVNIHNYTSDSDVSISMITRIFPRRNECRYKGSIHEQLMWNTHTPPSIDSSIIINHYGYLPAVVDAKNKIGRNLNLLLRELNSRPYDPYLWYQVGKTYSVQREYLNAIKYLNKSYELAGSKEDYILPNIIYQLCTVLSETSNYEKFLILINEAIIQYPDYTDLFFIYGRAIVTNRDIERFALIPTLFEHCINLGEVKNSRYETNSGVGTYKAYYNLGVYYELIGDINQAINYYSLSAKYGYTTASKRLEQFR